jgi:ABC-type multidrug transport system fused ATPase/permease subunit
MNRYLEAVKAAARVLPQGDKRKILTVIGVQIGLSFVDLFGVALVGIIGAVSITGIESNKPGNRTGLVLRYLGLNHLSIYQQVTALAVLAAVVLVSRTFLSMYFTKRYLLFLGRRSANITEKLFSKLISQSILKVQKRNIQETLFILTEGVRRITTGILGNFVFLVSDLSLLLVMTIGLLVVDPIVAVVTLLMFGSIAFILHIRMTTKSRILGQKSYEVAVESNKTIVSALSSYREIMVHNRRNYFSRQISEQRYEFADVDAETFFMPMVSKYVLESSVVLGAFVIAGLQFALYDSRHAIATLAIFMAAGSRIGPALMRIQQGLIQINVSVSAASEAFAVIDELQNVEQLPLTSDKFEISHSGFKPKITVNQLSFAYDPDLSATIKNVSFEIAPGQTFAIVGTSGAGKTTLVDLLLGVLLPTAGTIEISGVEPIWAIQTWPGAISYVPQEVALIEGSIRENICMGYPVGAIADELVWEAVDAAKLRKFIESSPSGLDTPVGELGSKISGGEKQRVGIARALISKPKLLILDEATSSLDGETEAEIAMSIQSIKGDVTIVMIAHRLSTVRNADQVLYLDKGRVSKIGSFQEVRDAIPNFDLQSKLMGL